MDNGKWKMENVELCIGLVLIGGSKIQEGF
jgi:hypothetical protein